MKNFRRVVDWFWKLAVSGLAYAVAGLVTAAVITVAGLHAPAMPAGVSAGKAEAVSLALSLLLAAGLAPLAAGLSGAYRARWLAVALLAFINLGLNTLIEAEIFTTTLKHGGAAFLILMNLGAAIAFAALLARLFGPSPAAAAATTSQRGAGHWAWRGAVAILAYPVIYYTFGMLVAPFVLPAYRAGVSGLVLPKVGLLIPVEVGRSVLYLLGSLPVIWLWYGSRRGLILTLGWAGAVTTGLYGLIQAYWFPPVLRIAHSLEITADSFVYALVIVMLLKPAIPLAGQAEPARPNVKATAA